MSVQHAYVRPPVRPAAIDRAKDIRSRAEAVMLRFRCAGALVQETCAMTSAVTKQVWNEFLENPEMLASKRRNDKDTERYGLTLRTSLKRDLETFADGYDVELADVMRTGAETLVYGYLPVLGKVPCGPLQEAVETTTYYEVAPPYLKPRPYDGDFLLEADGDSMAPKIDRGDLVMLRPDIEWSNGEICAVIVTESNGTAKGTLKRVFRNSEKKTYELRPINPDYESVEVKMDDLKVVGVFRGSIKRNS